MSDRKVLEDLVEECGGVFRREWVIKATNTFGEVKWLSPHGNLVDELADARKFFLEELVARECRRMIRKSGFVMGGGSRGYRRHWRYSYCKITTYTVMEVDDYWVEKIEEPS